MPFQLVTTAKEIDGNAVCLQRCETAGPIAVSCICYCGSSFLRKRCEFAVRRIECCKFRHRREIYEAAESEITGPVGQDLNGRLAKNCVTLDGFKLRTKIGLVRLTRQLRGVDLNASPRWAELMRVNSVAPRKLGVPLLIAQGSDDVLVAPKVTRRFAKQMCRAGQPLRFVEIAGGDHVTIAKRTTTATINWIGDRFADKAAQDDCSRL